MVVEEPRTGRVCAMQGGFDSRLAAFNRATQAERQPGSTIKPIVYSAALDNGMTPATIIVDGPFCVYQGARLGQKCFRNFGERRRRPADDALGHRTVAQPDDGARRRQIGMEHGRRDDQAMGVGDYPPYLSYRARRWRHDGAADGQRLCDARQPRPRASHPTLIDYRPGSPRQGDLARKLARLRRLQRARLGRQADAAPGDPRASQVIDPMTAYQMVHITEGVIQRGTATRAARSRPADVRQDRHQPRARPTCGSSAARRRSIGGALYRL